MAHYTVGLDDIDRADLDVVGGKGAGLGRLVRAGFPVPPGFVVTTAAYTDFLAAYRSSTSDRKPERIRKYITTRRLPEEIAAAVSNSYRALGAPAVAVRSSGTAEDLADASFAGQHDTFLGVEGERAVLEAVRDCWASLWNPHAVEYRQRSGWDAVGHDGRELALAVVVQRMVDAQWAGVMFTADPVRGDRERILIESVPGLGEALVSGQATGHSDVFDRRTGRFTTPPSALPGPIRDELARIGGAVERAFGAPQDVEWTCEGGQVYLVQARPLTALPEHATAGHESTLRRPTFPAAFMGNAIERMPHPPYPIDLDLFLRPAVRATMSGLRKAGFDAPDVDDVLVEIDDGIVQLRPPRIRPTARIYRNAGRTIATLYSTVSVRPDRWSAIADATLGKQLRNCRDTSRLAELSEAELADRMRRIVATLGALTPARFGAVLPGMLLATAALRLLARLLVGPLRADAVLSELMTDVPSVTTAANDELERIADRIRSRIELLRVYQDNEPHEVADRLRETRSGSALLDDVTAYLQRYGDRELANPTLGTPSLRERPDVVHGMLASMATVAAQRLPEGRARVRRAYDELAGSGLAGRLLAPTVRRLLSAARSAAAFREDSHYVIYEVFPVLRMLALEWGNRLVERGILTSAQDICYLTVNEASTVGPETAHSLVSGRAATRDAALPSYTFVPAELLDSSGGDHSDCAVRGTPASGGRAVGPVRVITDEAEFGTLGAGDVLVCRFTNPAWTPLFAVASAVVADGGSVASHAAIVAREYGIPAVMGTGNGTGVLTDGLQVFVDGDAGTVTPLDRAPAVIRRRTRTAGAS